MDEGRFEARIPALIPRVVPVLCLQSRPTRLTAAQAKPNPATAKGRRSRAPIEAGQTGVQGVSKGGRTGDREGALP